MESVINEVNALTLSLRQRKSLVFTGSEDDLTPQVETVINRARDNLATASEEEALAFDSALDRLRAAHGALRREFARHGRGFSDYIVPDLRREERTTPIMPDADDDQPPRQGSILAHPPFERAKLGLTQLEGVVTSYLACTSVSRVLEKTKLESKVATAKALLSMLGSVRTEQDWHVLDLLELDELAMSLTNSVKVAEDALCSPVASTPGLAAIGAYFPWNASTILANSTVSAGAIPTGPGAGGVLNLPRAPPLTNPNVTPVNLPVTVPVAPSGPGSGNGNLATAGSTDGNDSNPAGPTPILPSGPTQFPTGALYANWYQQTALQDMLTFSGKISDYLEWRETTVSLLNQDTRGPLHSFKTLKPLVQGTALEKIAHIRATNPQAVQEVFRILDEAYLDPKLLLEEINKGLSKTSVPDANDPESVRSYISKIRCTMEAYREAGRDPTKSQELFDKVMDKLPLEIQRPWVVSVPKSERSLHALILFLENWARATQGVTPKARTAASKTSGSKKEEQNKSGGKGGPQVNAATAGSSQETPETGKGKKGQTRKKGKQGNPASSTGGSTQGTSTGGGPTQGGSSTGGSSATGGSASTAPASSGAGPAPGNQAKRQNFSTPKPIYPPGYCPSCKAQGHDIECCPTFLALDPDARIFQAVGFRVHMTCLKSCDGPGSCTRRYRPCGVGGCDRFHHPVLHGAKCKQDWYQNGPAAATAPATGQAGKTGPQINTLTVARSGPLINVAYPEFGQHLRLIYVDVKKVGAPEKKKIRVLALIDGGCSRTFVNERLARKLRLPMLKDFLTINSAHGPQQELIAEVDFLIAPAIGGDKTYYPIKNACTRESLSMNGPAVNWRD